MSRAACEFQKAGVLFSRWASTSPFKSALFFFFSSCLLIQTLLAAEAKPIRRVLILNEVGHSYPLIELVDHGIRTTLANSPYQLEFYSEYFDTSLFPDSTTQQKFRDFYIWKYRNRKPDVIITVGPSPLQFMAKVHRTFFRGVPIVFCVPNRSPRPIALDSDFTGVEGDVAPAATLAAALRLLPNTKHVVVVTGVSAFDRQRQAVIEQELKPYREQLDISYTTDLAMPNLLEHLAHLPSNAVILLSAIGEDAAGTRFKSSESGPMIAAAANAPIFSLSDRFFEHGEVGGALSSALEQGKVTGNMALRLLNGEEVRNIPSQQNATVYMFDWRALQRWGLNETALPAGSTVFNRQPTFWEKNGRYVLAGLFVLLAQSVAIFALLWQRAWRRKAEAELRRSEEKFSRAFRRSPLALTLVRLADFRFLEVNDTFEQYMGWRRDELIGRTPLTLTIWVDTNQRSTFMKQLRAQGALRSMEILFRKKDGQVWTGLISSELIDVNGEPCALCVIADVTEQKMAEEALASLGGRLIEAQEAERTRIARELHDDINQQLAMVAVNLRTAKQHLPGSDTRTGGYIEEACARVSDLENDIQTLSHRLHSSRLEYLGLEAAANGFCREVSERQNVRIDFLCDGIPETLSYETSLCLFRVLQEAVHNAVKYSGVPEIEVSIGTVSNEIRLRVHDSGIGFDLSSTKNGHGLGLTSMRERLRLIRGYLSIDSSPQYGTTVLARVPLKQPANGASTAA